MVTRLRVWLLCALIVFLPLSAWLVSLSGNYFVALGRDILLILFLALSLLESGILHKPNLGVVLILAFVLLTLITYFFRQDSLAQWLRGVRYLTEPLVLFGALIMFPVEKNRQRWLSIALLTSIILVLVGALIDYFAPQLLRFSFDSSGRGFLGQIHLATDIARLQSTLAGPNALGLFLVVGLLLWPFYQSLLGLQRWLPIALALIIGVVVALTFSRSSYIGLFAGLIYFLVLTWRQTAHGWKYLIAVVFVGMAVLGAVLIFQPKSLTRSGSNAVRLEQYQRVWQQRDQIGFWGRGAGTTGLVSEYSFDKSPNHFSENSYLDVYESIGILGLLAYLAFWVWLVIELTKKKTLESQAASAAVFALVIAGLFINHYTGQAAIWLTLLFAGWLIAEPVTHLNPGRSPAAVATKTGASATADQRPTKSAN